MRFIRRRKKKFRADNLKPSGCPRLIVQFNISTAPRHVSRNCNCAMHAGIGNDFRFQLMELSVQVLSGESMRDSIFKMITDIAENAVDISISDEADIEGKPEAPLLGGAAPYRQYDPSISGQ